jgi:hypothetical protein
MDSKCVCSWDHTLAMGVPRENSGVLAVVVIFGAMMAHCPNNAGQHLIMAGALRPKQGR